MYFYHSKNNLIMGHAELHVFGEWFPIEPLEDLNASLQGVSSSLYLAQRYM
jgi:hypothetical protein